MTGQQLIRDWLATDQRLVEDSSTIILFLKIKYLERIKHSIKNTLETVASLPIKLNAAVIIAINLLGLNSCDLIL